MAALGPPFDCAARSGLGSPQGDSIKSSRYEPKCRIPASGLPSPSESERLIVFARTYDLACPGLMSPFVTMWAAHQTPSSV